MCNVIALINADCIVVWFFNTIVFFYEHVQCERILALRRSGVDKQMCMDID